MADIDPSFIGTVISSIPYDEAFGAPLSAAIDAQCKASNSALNFILSVGFNTDDQGVRTTNYAEFEFEQTKPDNTKETRRLKIPLVLLVKIPQLEITSGTISFDLEISQTAAVKENIDAGGEAEGGIGWGPFCLTMKAKASYSKECTRSSDTRAKQHIEMFVQQAEPPEALSILMEIMREAALGASAGVRPLMQPADAAFRTEPLPHNQDS